MFGFQRDCLAADRANLTWIRALCIIAKTKERMRMYYVTARQNSNSLHFSWDRPNRICGESDCAHACQQSTASDFEQEKNFSDHCVEGTGLQVHNLTHTSVGIVPSTKWPIMCQKSKLLSFSLCTARVGTTWKLRNAREILPS
jgi:hypothetical protein